jgi:hypothetical protein
MIQLKGQAKWCWFAMMTSAIAVVLAPVRVLVVDVRLRRTHMCEREVNQRRGRFRASSHQSSGHRTVAVNHAAGG